MEPTTDAFAPLADRPPFDEDQGDDLDEGPTQPVAEVLAFAAENGLSACDLVELALYSIEAVTGELFALVETEVGYPGPETAATIERLQIAAQIIADVSLFGDDEEDGVEGEGEADEGFEGEGDGEAEAA